MNTPASTASAIADKTDREWFEFCRPFVYLNGSHEMPNYAGICRAVLALNAAPTTQPAVKQGEGETPVAVKSIDGYLCRAWGESDRPIAEMVTDLDGVSAFMVREWLGSASQAADDGTLMLPEVMEELKSRDWGDEGTWSAEFEIGGVSVEKLELTVPRPERAAVEPSQPAPDEEPDLTVAYMAGVERGKDIAREQKKAKDARPRPVAQKAGDNRVTTCSECSATRGCVILRDADAWQRLPHKTPLWAHYPPDVESQPAPAAPSEDTVRLDYLQSNITTVEIVPGMGDFYPMRFRVGGLHVAVNNDIRTAIDAAIAASTKASGGTQ
ncbi:MAG: hypothetical protein ACRYGA_02075 [Janthinobacterium lividum]